MLIKPGKSSIPSASITSSALSGTSVAGPTASIHPSRTRIAPSRIWRTPAVGVMAEHCPQSAAVMMQSACENKTVVIRASCSQIRSLVNVAVPTPASCLPSGVGRGGHCHLAMQTSVYMASMQAQVQRSRNPKPTRPSCTREIAISSTCNRKGKRSNRKTLSRRHAECTHTATQLCEGVQPNTCVQTGSMV